MPFFFDLSSLIPTVERNPFEPVVVRDETPAELTESEIPAEPLIDTGLPIPSHYDFDLMRALVQDPFRIFVYWQLRDNPFDRLNKIFPGEANGNFHTVVKLIDETNNISVYFDAPFTRSYWFTVYPDRRYRVEVGVRSPVYGYIKLLSSQSVQTPRGGPSDQTAEEPEYSIAADDYLRVLRESHLVPERAFSVDGLLGGGGGAAGAAARNAIWDQMPVAFRRIIMAIADIQSGRDYDKWWERLGKEELAGMVREFLSIIGRMSEGELGYMLLLRYLPELLRRAILDQGLPAGEEIQIDKPITLFLAEKLGQTASEISYVSASENRPLPGPGGAPGAAGPVNVSHGQWLPSLNL